MSEIDSKNFNPHVVVYGDWKDEPVLDINRDGIADVTHDAVTEAIIESSGHEVDEKIQMPEYNVNLHILNHQEQYAQKSSDRDFSKTFFNVSLAVNFKSDIAFNQYVQNGLNKGAHYNIAAGNKADSTSQFDKPLPQHPRFSVVTASDGIIGDKKSETPRSAHLPHTTYTNRIENGRLQIDKVPGGYDITKDGIPDFTESDVSPNPFPDLSGKTHSTTDASADAEKILNRSSSKDIALGKTLTGQAMVNSAHINKQAFANDLYANYGLEIAKEDLSKIALDMAAFKQGYFIAYKVDNNGILQKLKTQEISWTSWATAEATKQDILKAEAAWRDANKR